MAKIFKGDVNFGFVINQTGAQPLDSRSVVQSYSELLKAETFGTAIYNGMTVATIDEQKVYMLVDKTKATVADGWKEIGAGGAVSVETYAEAIALASDENIGQVIYVKTKSSYDADGEGEDAAVEYDAAPYIVIGAGSLQKLAASTASGDIEGDVAELTTKVSGIETTVGNAEGGLVKDVADLKDAVAALPETFVTDVKDASGNSVVDDDGVVTLGDYATKEEVNNGLANKLDSSVYDAKMEQVDASLAEKIDASLVYTKDEVDGSLNLKADASTVYTKEEVNNSLNLKADASNVYAKSETYTQSEVNNLLANKADASTVYTKDEVDDAIQDVIEQIPAAPFQSVAEGDKVLTLNDGVLSSALSYAREEVEGVDSLVLKGIDGAIIGSVPVADFIADGMLESVTPEVGTNNFIFTFKTGNGTTESFKVDFSKYVDTYYADGETIELGADNTFNVKAGVFEAAGAAAAAEAAAKSYADGKFQIAGNYEVAGAAEAVETKLNEYKNSNDAAVAAKVDSSDYNAKVAEIDSSISSINTELAKKAVASEVNAALELKANAVDVYTSTKVDELLAAKVDNSAYNAKVAEIDGSISSINTSLDGKVDAVEGSSLVSDELITKLGNMVEIKSVDGDLAFTDGALSLDLSEYAKSAEVANTYVAKEEGKGLSTNDLTDDLLAKLNGIAAGAEVNYVKSVGNNLAVDGEGKLTVDLSALATKEEVNNGLATKLDASAKVNGVSFANGEATLDAGDIALEAAITRTGEDGEVENVYAAETSIQSVLANLSQRIDVLDPNVSGELGITSIVEGNGIKVETSGGQATISVKASAVDGNIAEVKTDGIYVAAPEVPDMRSYWEAI